MHLYRVKQCFLVILICLNIFIVVGCTDTGSLSNPEIPTQTVRFDALDWTGKVYQRHSALQEDLASWFVTLLAPETARNILDVGCGTGILLEKIIQKYPNAESYSCLDPSQSMLDQAQHNFKFSSPKISVDFYQGTAQTFVVNRKFDLVVSSLTFHWIPRSEQLKALNNILEHMKPGGVLAVVTAADKTDLPFGKALNEVMAKQPYKEILKDFSLKSYYFTTDEYSQWLNQAGFVVSRLEIFDHEMSYPSKKALGDFVRSFLRQGKYIEQVRPDLHEQFMELIMDSFVKHINDAPGGAVDNTENLKFQNPSIVILAQKPVIS